MDVELISLQILNYLAILEGAQKEGIEKAIRAFQRKPKLFSQVFQSVKDSDDEHFTFQIDLARFDVVMKSTWPVFADFSA